MSWIRENGLSYIQTFAINVMKCGEVPRHIAFIMDGNRRYASKRKVQKAEGHSKGFDKLAETLQWCLDLGVQEVTVYAFSIENFKRSKEEVDYLMTLAKEKFKRLIEEEKALAEKGVNVRVVGNLTMLPKDLLSLIAQAIVMTRNNNRVRLNVAFAYTAKDEMAAAAQTVAAAVADGHLQPEDVTSDLLQAAMYTENSPPPDLLIRTSGESRLSDFLLWQCAHSLIYFTPVLWPDFSLWDLLRAVFQYQRGHPSRPSAQKLSARAECYISELYENRYKALAAFA